MFFLDNFKWINLIFFLFCEGISPAYYLPVLGMIFCLDLRDGIFWKRGMEVQVEKRVPGDPNIPFQVYRKRGSLELQEFDDRRELLRHVFFNYGPGKYALKHMYGSGINCILIVSIHDQPSSEFVYAKMVPKTYSLDNYGFIDDVDGLIQPWIVGHDEYPDSGYDF